VSGVCEEMARMVSKLLDPDLQLRKAFMEGYVDIHFKDQDLIRRNFAQILRKQLFEVSTHRQAKRATGQLPLFNREASVTG
jgi:hypothetical protein